MSKSNGPIKIHPAANLFPLMDESELKLLIDDIKENGLRERLRLFDDQLIDGRNRLKALLKLKMNPWDYVDTLADVKDPVGYVLSLNLHRRQLNESQRAMVAAKVANLKHGQHPDGQICSSQNAADTLNVSRRLVTSAKSVLSNSAIGLQRMVEQGQVAASAAELVATLPKEEQGALVKQGADAVKEKAAEIRKAKKAESNGHAETNGKPVEREPGDDTETEGKPRSRPAKKAATVAPLKTEHVERVKGQSAIDKVKMALDEADKEIGRFIRAADDLKNADGMKNHKFVVDNYKIFAKSLAKAREDCTSLNGAWNSSRKD